MKVFWNREKRSWNSTTTHFLVPAVASHQFLVQREQLFPGSRQRGKEEWLTNLQFWGKCAPEEHSSSKLEGLESETSVGNMGLRMSQTQGSSFTLPEMPQRWYHTLVVTLLSNKGERSKSQPSKPGFPSSPAVTPKVDLSTLHSTMLSRNTSPYLGDSWTFSLSTRPPEKEAGTLGHCFYFSQAQFSQCVASGSHSSRVSPSSPLGSLGWGWAFIWLVHGILPFLLLPWWQDPQWGAALWSGQTWATYTCLPGAEDRLDTQEKAPTFWLLPFGISLLSLTYSTGGSILAFFLFVCFTHWKTENWLVFFNPHKIRRG